MKAAGVLIAVIGILVLLGGLGMDTTETTTTCYQADYSWDVADSSGCVETTYSNPAPKIAAVMLGFGMLIGGGVLVSRSGGRAGHTRTDFSRGGSESSAETSDSFAAKLEERQRRDDSE